MNTFRIAPRLALLLLLCACFSGLSCGKERPEAQAALPDSTAAEADLKAKRPGWDDLPYGPISASLGTMLKYPRSAWRNEDYEIFCFKRYPKLLYLVSGSFEIQSRFLKRLAFFTEKPGFTGTLAKDEDIAGLRDWFAHDYRAGDMARFFELARAEDFPLNSSETLLQDMLLAHGIIREEDGRITEGEGALIGLSVESADRLVVYYVHETIHGLEFTIPELEKLFGEFFRSLTPGEQELLRAALVYRGYNVLADERLLASEAAAYFLQQKPEETDRYFKGYIIPWYREAVKGKGVSSEIAALLKNPGIFGRRSAELEKSFEKITGLRAETFFAE